MSAQVQTIFKNGIYCPASRACFVRCMVYSDHALFRNGYTQAMQARRVGVLRQSVANAPVIGWGLSLCLVRSKENHFASCIAVCHKQLYVDRPLFTINQATMKILIIEDEEFLREAIKHSLEREYFIVETAPNFAVAHEKLSIYTYDCILLDITLPDGSGINLLRTLKNADESINVIIISAKDSLEDKLEGLELGADDYLTKPFHIAELNARVKAVLRRKKLAGSETLTFGNLSLDLSQRLFYINGQEIKLNRKEFDIIQYFMFNNNRLISKIALAEHVWGDYIDQSDNFNFIYSQIKNIKRKLETNGASVEIHSVYGVGYKMVKS